MLTFESHSRKLRNGMFNWYRLLVHSQVRLMVMLALVLVTGECHAQQPQFPATRLATVTPCGANAGADVEVTLGGGDLDEVSELYFSHPGFKAVRLPDPPPAAKPMNPPPVVSPRFKVSIAPGTPVGSYDVRAIGKWGISNPRAFMVSDLKEVMEKEPNNDVPEAQRVELNSIVNGTIDRGVDVDYFAFAGKKDQRVVIACAASSIDSRLTPLIQLFDSADRQLAANRHYRDRNAVLDCILPSDGDYLIRVSEHAYVAGGPEYFYRLTITTAPWIDAAYPPVVEPGKTTSITLYGRNLPGGQPDPKVVTTDGHVLEKAVVQVTAPVRSNNTPGPAYRGLLFPCTAGIDGFEYRTRNAAGLSNPVLLTYATAPVVLDNEDNDDPAKAQEIPVPCEVCGRIEKRRDADWYTFTARKDDVYTIEGYSDRIGAPIDLVFLLRRADNEQLIGEFDDHPDIPPTTVGKFFVHTDDPKTRFVVPADGKYQLKVTSRTAFNRSGPRHIYRLSIRKETPGFHLVVVGNNDPIAGGCTIPQGGCQDYQVVCFRHDNFEGEVTLQAEGLPPGVTCPPQVLGPNLKQTNLIFTAAPDAKPWAGEIRVLGKAVIDGTEVVQEAHAGCLVWPTQQNNVPAISRLARSLCLAVRDKAPYRLDTPNRELAAMLGSTLDIKLAVDRQSPSFKAPIQITRLCAPAQPNGQFINVPNLTINPNQTEASLKLQIPNNTPPGVYNLVFQGVAQFPYAKEPKGKPPNVQVREVSPPIRVTVYKAVAEVSLGNAKLTIPAGKEVELPVKVKRLFDFKGDLVLTLVLPNGFQGVTAAPVTIPAGANEAKLLLKAATNAKPVTNSDILVRATARVNQADLSQDVKLTVAITGSGEAAPSDQSKDLTLLAEGADGWKYLPAGQVKGDSWRTVDFKDGGWKSGKAPLGYGEDEIAKRKGTIIAEQGQDVLFRRVFEVPTDLLSQPGATFHLAVASDDSAVVYLNGTLADQDPEGDHEFTYWNREVSLSAKQLRPGKNVIAVLVKNKSGNSDLYLDLQVTAQVPSKGK